MTRRVLSALVLVLVLCGVGFFLSRRLTLDNDFLITRIDSNVLSASVLAITSGTNHTFKYHPAWRINSGDLVSKTGLRKYASWVRGTSLQWQRGGIKNGVLSFPTPDSCHILWVRCERKGIREEHILSVSFTDARGYEVKRFGYSFEDPQQHSTLMLLTLFQHDFPGATNSVIRVASMQSRQELFTIQPRPSH